MARSTPRTVPPVPTLTLHLDMIRAASMLLPLGLAVWMPLPKTAWVVPFVWKLAVTHISALPHIRAFPDNPVWWMPVWSGVVIISRAVLVQAAAIFQVGDDSIARSLLFLHAWVSMLYMTAFAWFVWFVWFTYVASHRTIPVPLIARPFPRLHVVF